MKQLIFTIIFGTCLGFSTLAADVSGVPFAHESAEQTKVPVRPEDLPESVKSTLAGDDYAEWKVATAYLITRENNAQYYEINLKKGEETTTVSLDKYGRKVD